MTDRIEAGTPGPATQPWPAGLAPDNGQPVTAATAVTAGPAGPAGATAPNRKALVAGAVVVLLIIVAIVSHVIASGNAISAGDCVVTNPNALTGWDIKKVACNSDPGPGETLQKVVSVQNGTDGQCDPELTAFEDDPSNKTYCLSGSLFGIG